MPSEAYAIKHIATGKQFVTPNRKAAWENRGFAKLAFVAHKGIRFDEQNEWEIVRLVEENKQ